MKRNQIISILIIAVLIILSGGYFALKPKADKNSATSQDTSMKMEDSSSASQFATLKGEEYDRMFLSNMIAHHQGAVDMAKLAQANAKHTELKELANAIVSAQTSEISDMQSWQSQWGYPASSGEMMEDHSSMGMTSDMASMTQQLEGKTGDEFDKLFLKLMIEHHNSALDMAQPGESNAQHTEVKDLSKAIVTAQTKEIAQMKQWQKEWGYTN